MNRLKGFSFKNDVHLAWLDGYLRKFDQVPIIQDHYFSLSDIYEEKTIRYRFEKLVKALHSSAEGRERWRRLNAAWLKKSNRDKAKQNGKKYYSFELSAEFELNLKTLSGDKSYKETLESLVNGALTEMLNCQRLANEQERVSLQNNKIAQLREELRLAKEEIQELKSKLDEKSMFSAPGQTTLHLKF